MLDAAVGSARDPVASHAFLLVLSGSDPGRLHVLEQPEMVIGRSRFADIHISERALSQQHCKITRYGEHHRLFDLGSTNGTFVNDVKVQQADLKPGDSIRTGETVFTYMSAGQAASHAAGPAPAASVAPPPGGFQGAGPVVSGSMNPPMPSTALVRTARPRAASNPSAALVRRAPQPLITLAEGGYAGAPQVVELPPTTAEAQSPDMLARILWVIGFLRRYWLSIALLGIIGGGLGVASYKFFKPSAKAEFELNLVQQASDNPTERMRRTNFEFFRSAEQNFKRPGLIYETLKQLGESEISQDRIRGAQASLVFTKNRRAKYTYNGSYEAGSPDEAINFLNVHLELYKQAEVEKALKVLLAEVETLETRLSEAEQELTTTTQAILAFQQEHSEGLPATAAFNLKRALDLRVQRSTMVGQVTRSAAQAQVARKALRSQDPVIQARIAETAPYAASIADLERRLAEASAQGKGSEHPEVRRMQEEKRTLEALRDRVIKEGTSKVISSKNPAHGAARSALEAAEADERVAQAELARITKELEEAEGVSEKIPRLQAEYADLTRAQTAVQTQYNTLFSQLNGTRVRLDLEYAQAEARFEIVTPPNVAPVSRLKTIIIRGGIGLFVGLFLGIGLGVMRELRRYLTARIAAARR